MSIPNFAPTPVGNLTQFKIYLPAGEMREAFLNYMQQEGYERPQDAAHALFRIALSYTPEQGAFTAATQRGLQEARAHANRRWAQFTADLSKEFSEIALHHEKVGGL